jgi:sulfatase maturation enzyme AslB (radical SAM superfamily)
MSISLDGNKDLHDKCRFDLSGQGTYDRVVNNIKLYKN